MSIIHAAKQRGMAITGILHIGACMLEEAEEYEAAGVKTVTWVEAQPPNPQRQERARRFGHALYEGCPLSNVCERVTLRLGNNVGASSLLPMDLVPVLYPDIYETGETITLWSQRGDVVLLGLPETINMCVIDVQGYELHVLKGLGRLLDRFVGLWVETEFQSLYRGAPLWPETKAWLEAHRFCNFDVTLHPSLAWGDVFCTR